MREYGNDCVMQSVDPTPKGQPEFERIFQNLSTNISDVDFLTTEILASISKFKECPIKEYESKPEKEPIGVIENFESKVNYMRRVINKLGEANNALKNIV